MREQGKVKWFDNERGYGFITREDKTDIFVHYKAIKSEGYKQLSENQIVEFEPSKGQKGMQANDVVVIG